MIPGYIFDNLTREFPAINILVFVREITIPIRSKVTCFDDSANVVNIQSHGDIVS